MSRTGLAIVLCTYNRAPLLAELLASLARELCDRLDLEVIVVDNNCTDETAAVVEGFQGRLPGLRRVVETAQGLSFARNRGAAEATKDYLLYLDDEDTLPTAYLDRLEVVLRRFAPDLFGGPVLPRFDRALPAWFDANTEARQFEKLSGFSATGSLTGANFGIRRAVLGALGPFDTALGMKGGEMGFGEDREMVERYRAATPPDRQRLYYAVELSVLQYTMPYKLSRRYQWNRAFGTSAALEITYAKQRRRGLAKSALLAAGHVVLLPFFLAVILKKHGFGARGQFEIVKHLYAVAGRAHGVLAGVTKALRRPRPDASALARSNTPSRPPNIG